MKPEVSVLMESAAVGKPIDFELEALSVVYNGTNRFPDPGLTGLPHFWFAMAPKNALKPVSR